MGIEKSVGIIITPILLLRLMYIIVYVI